MSAIKIIDTEVARLRDVSTEIIDTARSSQFTRVQMKELELHMKTAALLVRVKKALEKAD